MTREAGKDYIVQKLRADMAELGVTQAQLAAACQVAESTVSNWMAGKAVLSATSYLLLEKFVKAQRRGKKAKLPPVAAAESEAR